MIELFLIQSIDFSEGFPSEGFSKVFKNSSLLLQQTRLYYLQQSCVNQSFLSKRKRPLLKMLKRIEPNIEPCSNPDNNVWKAL